MLSVTPDAPGRLGDTPQYGPATSPSPTDAPVRLERSIEGPNVAGGEAVTARQRALAERLLLGALRERDAARRAIEAGERAKFLASAGRDLAIALDRGVIHEIVRRCVLPRDGSWCIVELVESDGAMQRLAVAHPDPAKEAVARSLEESWIQGGDAARIAAAHGVQNLELVRELGFGALLAVPLTVGDRCLGKITFVTREGDAPLSADEIALASDLAELCAFALDNARLNAHADRLRMAAEVANHAKSEFLGNMTHELLSPLNAIGGYVDLMEMELHGAVTSEQRSDLERIKHNQQHLVDLIRGILEYVHSESGRIQYRPADVRVEPMLREVADMLAGAAKHKELAIDVQPGEDDATIWADPMRVRQILVNLVTNAVKYSGSGSGAIVLSSDAAAEVVTVHVTDNGPGIAADKLELIFAPFVQLGDEDRDRQGGVGLGLAISRDLARAMKGDLTVESRVGAGSRFTLTLPREARPDAVRLDPNPVGRDGGARGEIPPATRGI